MVTTSSRIDRLTGRGEGCGVIAAIDFNHNGKRQLAERLVASAADAGCDAVKIAVRRADNYFLPDALDQPSPAPELGATLGDLLRGLELSPADLCAVRNAVPSTLAVVAAPYDLESLELCRQLDPDAYQIDYPVLRHEPLLRAVAAEGRPTMLCAAAVEHADILAAAAALGDTLRVLLHGVIGAPVTLDQTALGLIPELRAEFGNRCAIGYYGLEDGIAASIAAFVLGARVIERRITLERELTGPWHRFSLDVHALKELVHAIRGLEASLGARGPRRLTVCEIDALSEEAVCLVAAAPLKAHDVLRAEDVAIRAPARGLGPLLLGTAVGKRLLYDVPPGTPITFGILEP